MWVSLCFRRFVVIGWYWCCVVGFACLRSPFLAFCSTKWRGVTFMFARLLVRAPIDGPGSQPTDTVDHQLSVQSVLSCPLWPLHHRVCVIAERLGHLRCLAHAAGHGHFQGASTSRRTASFVSPCSPQKYKTLTRVSLRHCCHLSVLQRVFSAPPGASCTVVLRTN